MKTDLVSGVKDGQVPAHPYSSGGQNSGASLLPFFLRIQLVSLRPYFLLLPQTKTKRLLDHIPLLLQGTGNPGSGLTPSPGSRNLGCWSAHFLQGPGVWNPSAQLSHGAHASGLKQRCRVCLEGRGSQPSHSLGLCSSCILHQQVLIGGPLLSLCCG